MTQAATDDLQSHIGQASLSELEALKVQIEQRLAAARAQPPQSPSPQAQPEGQPQAQAAADFAEVDNAMMQFIREYQAMGLTPSPGNLDLSPPEVAYYDKDLVSPGLPPTLTRTQGAMVVVYDYETGRPSKVLRTMVENPKTSILNYINPLTGNPRFTARPRVKPEVARYVCLLHPEHPQRKVWDSLGLRALVCKKRLMSEMDVEMHTKNKHQTAWQRIERWRVEQHENQYREMQRIQMEALQAIARGQQLLVAPEAATVSTSQAGSTGAMFVSATLAPTPKRKRKQYQRLPADAPPHAEHCQSKGGFGKYTDGCERCALMRQGREMQEKGG